MLHVYYYYANIVRHVCKCTYVHQLVHIFPPCACVLVPRKEHYVGVKLLLAKGVRASFEESDLV